MTLILRTWFPCFHILNTLMNLGFILDSNFKLFSSEALICGKTTFDFAGLWAINAFITSRLDYCYSLLIGVGQYSLSRWQLVQNAAACILVGALKRGHITPIQAFLHRLPVYFRVQFKILLFVFKYLNGLAPPYVSELLSTYTSPQYLRSPDQLLLEVQGSKW